MSIVIILHSQLTFHTFHDLEKLQKHYSYPVQLNEPKFEPIFQFFSYKLDIQIFIKIKIGPNPNITIGSVWFFLSLNSFAQFYLKN